MVIKNNKAEGRRKWCCEVCTKIRKSNKNIKMKKRSSYKVALLCKHCTELKSAGSNGYTGKLCEKGI